MFSAGENEINGGDWIHVHSSARNVQLHVRDNV